ncbi:molybdenum cofactor guanylyltransferase [Alcaligenes pakistanensis]|uniref:Molybdenum cofactor guanylyltransferase n=1 Tax=Alcaligenes pakistanensis TaxID=1482717 RepID=A0A8H9IGY1_9BURK|nr:molybdenum cofactor guanylyltransferase MobA [Alcaligenes pakistanensis]MBP6620777.1 molybdenum cofactor guanylyltransferase [Alcaligenes sp.]GHC43818.1 molybdenum cofactor guanylyltransferase [Alcaligenes pakistanensis]
MISTQDISGIVLAGGRARRFDLSGQVDKGLLLLQGQPLVQHLVRRLRPQVGPIFISANRNPEQYVHWGRVVPDTVELEGYLGPLAGLASVLDQVTTPWALSCPVDLPFVPAELGKRLIKAVQEQGAVAAYAQAERSHPLCLLLRTDQSAALKEYLLSGERRVMSWLHSIGAVEVDFRDAPAHAFFNINTPQDLETAQGW